MNCKKLFIYSFTCLIALFVFTMSAMAVPAKRGVTKELVLTDGSRVTATLVGDEHGHFWLGADGKAYQAIDGATTYQSINADEVKEKAQAKRAASNERRMRRMAPRRIGGVGSITGKKKGLIILVNFKGQSFAAGNDNALFQRIANEENFSSGDFKGSMRDYFYAQSEGQFELTFDVVGPVEVANSSSYYGSNDSSGNDKYPATMVIEALKLADSQVNYANYDWDGDGEVEQVYVVYAGKGEADGGAANTIWPHEWELSSAATYGDGSGAQTLDGVTINTYACGGELNGSTGSVAGIGTMCHEFSHCLGYPDFYDTDYSGGQGMGYWDLMDSGSYNDDGYQPAGFTSYERWVAGWKEPIELTSTTQVDNMKALQDNGSNTYIIYNSGNSNEYFLLENRQKKGWDQSLPGEGLLILHVDYSASAWSSNTPNDTPSHQRMTWIAADNKYQYTTYDGVKYYTEEGMANDPFPYGSVNAFGESTTPAAKLFNKNASGTNYLESSVENITQNADGTVSFKFRAASNVAAPTFSPKAGRYAEAQTVSISCATEGATIYYTTDGSAPSTSSTVFTAPITISETTVVKAMAVADGEESKVASAKYTIGASTSDPNTTTFRLVESTDYLEPDMRYIIACGSKARAAGSISKNIMSSETVVVDNDVITIGSGVAVFVLEQTDDGWTFMNEDTEEYLYATAAKKVAYDSEEQAWSLNDGTAGVTMTFGDYGTILYNVSSPRFTTYTSNPTAAMIQANLYMEDSNATPSQPTPVIVADETLNFTAKVGAQQTVDLNVLSENLTEDITLTLTDADDVFSLSATTIDKSQQEATVQVTFTPTAAGTFTGTVTLTSTGAETATVTLTATATEDGGETGGDGDYVKVTSAPTDWSGQYLIVYENGSVAMNGGLETLDAVSNTIGVTISNATIPSTDDTDAASFTIEAVSGGYTIKSASGYYIGQTTDANGLKASAKDAYTNVLSLVSDGVNIVGSGGAYLRYNKTSGQTRFRYFKSATYTGQEPVALYRKTDGVVKQDVTLAFSATTATVTLGEEITEPTLTTTPEGLAVTYTSSKPSVATVDTATGEVTIAATGTTTITATFAGNDEYNSGSAAYTLTVKAEATDDENSADNPYTVAEAQALFDNDELPSDFVYVKGIVSTVSEVSTQYGNATYYISDDGTADNQLLVYRGKYLDEEAFTSANQILAGDTVIVYGNLILYHNTTREFNAGNYLISLSRSEGTTPIVDSDRYELVADAATLADGDEVLIAYVNDNYHYALGPVRSNKSSRKAVEVTLNSDGTITPGEDAKVITLEKVNDMYMFKIGNGYLYASSSKSNELKVTEEPDDNAKATITITDGDAAIIFQGSNTHNILRFNINNQDPLFSCYGESTSVLTDPQIYRKVVTPIITVTGDVNKDGSITIADVTALVNIILGKDNTEPYQYDHEAADVNTDGSITIADVTALVNVILGK